MLQSVILEVSYEVHLPGSHLIKRRHRLADNAPVYQRRDNVVSRQVMSLRLSKQTNN